MSARERILTIRLLEKLGSRPAYANALGVEVTQKRLEDDAASAEM